MERYEVLLDVLTGRAPWDEPDAARALHATLGALARRVPAHLGEQMARELAPELARDLRASARAGVTRPLFDEIGQELGVDHPRAIEFAELAFGVLREQWTGETLERLLRELPELDDWNRPLERVEASPRSGHGDTLADGSPGSRRPLSEASPYPMDPVSEASASRRQHESVAAPNPHADTKLSSARGLTQEREHESLAEGRGKQPG